MFSKAGVVVVFGLCIFLSPSMGERDRLASSVLECMMGLAFTDMGSRGFAR